MSKLLTSVLLMLALANPAYALAASLSLFPATGTFNKSCQFNVDIKLDTNGQQTDGTDSIVIFDAAKLRAEITQGSLYPEYPGNNVDNEAGKITVSGLSSPSSVFSGQGTLATIKFTVKDTSSTGATIVKFDYDPSGKNAPAQCMSSGSNTCDSNIVPRGSLQDILSSVNEGNYTIGTGTSCAAVAQGAVGQGQAAVVVVSTPSAQIPVKEIPVKEVPVKILPPAGSEQFTFMVAILGSVLVVLGVLGLTLL